MARYFRIYRVFFTSSFVRELEFRANFIAKVAQQFVWVFFFILMLLVIYNRTPMVAGWSRNDAFVLASTLFLLESMWRGCFMALLEFPQMIRQGSLDFVLTKPVDAQFWVSLRRFNFDQVGTLIGGAAMMTYALSASGLRPSFEQWACFVVLFACALAIFYAFNLAMITTAIWFIRVDNLWVLGETVLMVARQPTDIFGVQWGRFFTMVVPLAFLSTVPSSQLVRGADIRMVLIGLGWATASLIIVRTFWRWALKSYGSASS
ncbi:MAG: ABC-2 family transporter protein [Fimbriimonadaceae bacterium]